MRNIVLLLLSVIFKCSLAAMLNVVLGRASLWLSVDSVGSCMTLSAMDQVALGKTFEGSSGLLQSRRSPGDRGINLKQQAC